MPTKVENDGLVVFKSDITAIAGVVTLSGLKASHPHCFVGVRFFSDAGGVTQVAPTAGVVALTAETINNEGVFEAFPGNSISASGPTTVGVDANLKSVRATPSAVSGNAVSHYQLIVSQNKH